ncbi:TatD family hydrolase [Magnetococcus sp. PR-3]|uniref:TatD family hydrolase n=1 Tax=Magnetococcus sp. PR-3 TaxID=3120355 RepID=UPI002FCDF5F0
MIDTHCHLDAPLFDHDRMAMLARSRGVGVRHWVLPAVTLARLPKLLALQGPGVTIALGLHPIYLHQHPQDALTQLQRWLDQVKPPLMGEIGLDHACPKPSHAAQRTLFEGQLEIAQARGLPVLLHVRKAHEQVLQALKHRAFSHGGIVHAFNGSLDQAARYRRMGFKLGFGGMLTRPHSRKLHALARTLPETDLVLETDAPDMPPHPHKGQRNEPALLPYVAQKLADLRGVALAQMVATTTANAQHALKMD